MNATMITLKAQTFLALPSGALYWPAQAMLILSDLHLGKSERLARRGGALLPPYETRETLMRLDADLQTATPDRCSASATASTMRRPPRRWVRQRRSGSPA